MEKRSSRGQYRLVKFGPFILAPTIWLLLGASLAEPTRSPPEKGETHELTLIRDSIEQSSDGSSQSSSHDQDSIVERVLAVSADGVQLEYDLPATSSADDKRSQWQFPVRILRSPDGRLHLLNSSELEARIDRWLKRAGWPRAACGHWIFTWNGFKIECDPQSAVKAVEAFDLTSVDLNDRALYRDADALAPARLMRKAYGDGYLFSAKLQVNANAVRRARAETDVAIGEVTNRPVSLDTALRKHANDKVTGTISLRFETDRAGTPIRRTKITKLISLEADGKSTMETITEVLSRKAVARR